MSFGKIFETVFTGSMFGSGPTVFAVWAYVIATARPPGICELNPRALAACIGCSTEDVRKAIEYLCSPDPDSRNPSEDGKRLIHLEAFTYEVTSFQKYRDMRDDDHRREYQRLWISEKRAQRRQKASTAVDTTSTDIDSRSLSTKAEAEAEDREKKKRVEARASRFALDSMPDNWRDFCQAERTDLDPDEVWNRFADYWRAVPGAKGRKLDWTATWRNWVRNETGRRRNEKVDINKLVRELEAQGR